MTAQELFDEAKRLFPNKGVSLAAETFSHGTGEVRLWIGELNRCIVGASVEEVAAMLRVASGSQTPAGQTLDEIAAL